VGSGISMPRSNGLRVQVDDDRLEERLNTQLSEVRLPEIPADCTLIDTNYDGTPDSIVVDTVGDGIGDTIIPLASTGRLQRFAQEMVASTSFKVFSLGVTLTQLGTCMLADEEVPREIFRIAEMLTCTALVGESFCRWWAERFTLRFLFRPIMILDLLNILPLVSVIFNPTLTSANPAFAASRLFRATRVLRLARLLGKGDLPISEVTRTATHIAFSGLALVMVPAGFFWELEREVNDDLRGYGDALYFAITTLTTVGYGDITPVTRLGRLIVSFQMLSAVSLIPYEVSNLFTVINKARSSDIELECPKCGLREHAAKSRFCCWCGASITRTPTARPQRHLSRLRTA